MPGARRRKSDRSLTWPNGPVPRAGETARWSYRRRIRARRAAGSGSPGALRGAQRVDPGGGHVRQREQLAAHTPVDAMAAHAALGDRAEALDHRFARPRSAVDFRFVRCAPSRRGARSARLQCDEHGACHPNQRFGWSTGHVRRGLPASPRRGAALRPLGPAVTGLAREGRSLLQTGSGPRGGLPGKPATRAARRRASWQR
jgi:hypothetical protein